MFAVELYAKIRRSVMVDGLSRREAAKRFGVHRNTITKMLQFSIPPGYRRRERPASKKLGPYMAWIDAILEGDRSVHKKQRHTAHRIFERLRDERGFSGGYTIVREYVARTTLRIRETFVPLNHRPGHAQAHFVSAVDTPRMSGQFWNGTRQLSRIFISNCRSNPPRSSARDSRRSATQPRMSLFAKRPMRRTEIFSVLRAVSASQIGRYSSGARIDGK
ncbi:MAG: hypothetical protein ACREQH_15480 [Candidatus Binatus sp.]